MNRQCILRNQRWFLICCTFLVILTLDRAPLAAQTRSEIKRWARAYCRVAADFMPYLNPQRRPKVLPRRTHWEEFRYVFIDHYKETLRKAKQAVRDLNEISVPQPDTSILTRVRNFISPSKSLVQEAKDAQRIHDDTIDAMKDIQRAAESAIRDVRNAKEKFILSLRSEHTAVKRGQVYS